MDNSNQRSIGQWGLLQLVNLFMPSFFVSMHPFSMGAIDAPSIACFYWHPCYTALVVLFFFSR